MIRAWILLSWLAVGGCATLPEAIEPGAITAGWRKQVFVFDHGIHTGIVVEATELNERMPELAKRFGSSRYYEIGWGDAGFYQADEITSRLTVSAVLWPTESVVHVVGFSYDPIAYFPHSEGLSLEIPRGPYETLLQFLESSFARGENGEILMMGKGKYGESQFYRGVGRYYMFNTCNNWTARALYSAGVDLNPSLRMTADSLMSSLRKEVQAK